MDTEPEDGRDIVDVIVTLGILVFIGWVMVEVVKAVMA